MVLGSAASAGSSRSLSTSLFEVAEQGANPPTRQKGHLADEVYRRGAPTSLRSADAEG